MSNMRRKRTVLALKLDFHKYASHFNELSRDLLGGRAMQAQWPAELEGATPTQEGMSDGPISRDFGFWHDRADGGAGEVYVPVHQWTDATDLHESW
jgi:hypothetical protein